MAIFKLDIREEHCPMTFVKTKLTLSRLHQGDVLEVLVKEGEPLENIPKSAEEQGFKIIKIEDIGDGNYQISIQK